MRRRMGRPGLVGTMARTAVIAGTANATSNAMENRRAAKSQAAAEQQAALEAQAQLAELQAQQAAPPPPPPAQDADLLAQLKQLADLKAAGVLDDAEFAAAKAKLLA